VAAAKGNAFAPVFAAIHSVQVAPETLAEQCKIDTEVRSMPTQDWAESLYYQVAQDALALAKQIALQPLGDETEFGRKKAVATVIVFSALCLEGFINRQSFEHLPAAERRKFYKLSHKAKWLRLPKLIDEGNKEFDREGEPFRTFGELVDLRNNRLVHFKPQAEGSTSIPFGRKDWAEIIGDVQLGERYLKCVCDMTDELRCLTGNQTPASTLLDQKYTRSVMSSLRVPFETGHR